MIKIGDLVAILTALGVATYVLGLVGLAIPMRNITKDMSTAWYATSLIPRTVVAAQGASIWLQWPLFITVSTSLACTVTLAVYPDAIIYVMPIVIFLAWGRAAKTAFGKYGLYGPNLSNKYRFYIILGLYAVSLCGACLVGFAAIGLGITLTGELSRAYESWGSFRWIMIEFAGALLIGLPFGAVAEPSLLEVQIDKRAEDSTDGVRESLKGRLVAHSDGFWHLFDENDKLLSIPDDKVFVVQIPGQ